RRQKSRCFDANWRGLRPQSGSLAPVAGARALLLEHHQAPITRENMATTNGWGLIGTGRIADDRILPGINAFDGNKLIGVCSRDQGRADAFAAKFGAQRAYTSYDEMLRNPDITV